MLHDELQSLVLSNAPGDAWSFIWNNSAYSSQRFYGLNFIGLSPPIPFVWNWKTKCINKIKVFMWLLFCDLLNTRDMQDRRNCAQEDANLTCALCALGVRETREHLFLLALSVMSVGGKLASLGTLIWNFFQMLVLARLRFRGKGFLEIFSIACWHIWKQRNALIFQGVNPHPSNWFGKFKAEVLLHECRMNELLLSSVLTWLQSL